MKRTLWVLGCALCVLCSACYRQVVVTDESMPQEIRQTIHTLNDQVIAAYEKRDTNRLMEIFNRQDDAFRKGHGTFINQFGGREIYGKGEVLKDFYYKGNSNQPMVVAIKTPSGTGYQYKFVPVAEEEVISWVCLENGRALHITYVKEDERWNLRSVKLDIYRMLGEDVFGWYEVVKAERADKKLLSAYVACCLTIQMIDRTGQLVCTGTNEMGAQCRVVVKEFEKALTQKAGALTTSPEILKKNATRVAGRYYPQISYRTQIALADTAAIRRECDLLDVSLRELHQPTDLIGDTIYYQVYASDQREKADFVFAKGHGK